MTEKSTLTAREIEVLVGVSKGLTAKEIGWELNISVGAVSAYMGSVFIKLRVHSAVEAVNAARAQGIIS
jgi:DNA-binding CsgD family transcriptional regulator